MNEDTAFTMAFLGAFSKFEERVPLPADSTQNAMVQQFRRLLFEDFGFIEAARRQSGLYEGAYLNVEDFSSKFPPTALQVYGQTKSVF